MQNLKNKTKQKKKPKHPDRTQQIHTNQVIFKQ